jgi:ABC-type sugar transport system permease subunit
MGALLLLRDWDEKTPYIVALVVGTVPLVYSRVGRWSRSKSWILTAVAVIFAAIVFTRVIPGQLDAGRPWIIPRYLVMTSGLEDAESQDYLEDVFPADTLSSLWIYGAVAGVLFITLLLEDKKPRARRYLLYGSLVFFTLLMIGSFMDGVRYFDAFERIAEEEGARNYHFARFRDSMAVFPDSNRNPAWMTSELWTKSSLILITMWSSGAGMLIFLAALKGVPQSLYEAAEVDGASRVQKFFKITLPMISPAMFYNVVIGMIAALQTFEAVYILRTPDTTDSLASAAYYLYERTFRQLAIGEGSAMSWILALIIVTLTIMQFRYSEWVHYEA